ncbi:hypothetical protein [Bradyrhizobium sp.]|uniref:hypothetical protein n=1 Tax=Bradyrhizobium sp. TaxID=376 RepID=UPI0027210317|nr:hypothetical protein [Bradyrhizobium sp.]MDO9299423.1 hypothetical protein [Bradyrhizobium sp.]
MFVLAIGFLLATQVQVSAQWKFNPIPSLNPKEQFDRDRKGAEEILKKPFELPKHILDAGNVCKQADNVRKTVNQARDQFASALGTVPIPKEGIVLFDIRTDGNFTYNAQAGSAGYKLTLPFGAEVDKAKVKSNSEGHFSAPPLDVKKIVAGMGFVKIEPGKGYDQWADPRRRVANKYVYVASKRFVDAISESRVAQEVGWAIFTAGSTVEGSVATLKEQLILEWSDIVAWLQRAGEENAPEIARKIIEDLFALAGPRIDKLEFDTSKMFKLPNLSDYGLELKFDLPEYEYSASLPFLKQFEPVLSLLGYMGRLPKKQFQEKHLGFSISLTTKRDVDAGYIAMFQTFTSQIANGPSQMITDFLDKLPGGNAVELKKISQDLDFSKSIRALFKPLSSNIAAELEKRHKGNGIFDFTDSQASKNIEQLLRAFAIGKEGQATVKRLLVDAAQASVLVDFDLRHKHRLTKKEILEALGKGQKATDWPFDKAKDACKLVQDSCKNDIARLAPFPVCGIKTDAGQLNPLPAQAIAIMSDASIAQTPTLVGGDPTPTSTPKQYDAAGLKLPIWCVLAHQSFTFEVTLDGVVRGLTGKFSGFARRAESGNIVFRAHRSADLFQLKLPFTEAVTGIINLKGDLAVQDFDRASFAGRCRSVL